MFFQRFDVWMENCTSFGSSFPSVAGTLPGGKRPAIHKRGTTMTKTAGFLALLFALPMPAAFSQAAVGYAGAASQMSGSAQAAGHSASAATSQATDANAAATQRSVSGTAQSSTNAAAQAGKTSAGAMQASNVSAELEKKIDSKHAKVGDEVVAHTTSSTQLEGTKLPKGTRLMGKVTEVQAKSGAQHDGHLAFAFDRAVMRDGREIPIHTTLQAISAPAGEGEGMSGASDDFAAGFAPVAASGGGSARAGGGLLGGGGAAAGGLAGGATSTVAGTTGRAAGFSEGTLRQTDSTLRQSTTGALHEGSGLMATSASTAAAVRNMPGVSASGSASGTSTLDAHGKNVELESGTQMMFSVAK
jgi:hypothetical protein